MRARAVPWVLDEFDAGTGKGRGRAADTWAGSGGGGGGGAQAQAGRAGGRARARRRPGRAGSRATRAVGSATFRVPTPFVREPALNRPSTRLVHLSASQRPAKVETRPFMKCAWIGGSRRIYMCLLVEDREGREPCRARRGSPILRGAPFVERRSRQRPPPAQLERDRTLPGQTPLKETRCPLLS